MPTICPQDFYRARGQINLRNMPPMHELVHDEPPARGFDNGRAMAEFSAKKSRYNS